MLAFIRSIETESFQELCQLLTKHQDWLLENIKKQLIEGLNEIKHQFIPESWHILALSQAFLGCLHLDLDCFDQRIVEDQSHPLKIWAKRQIKDYYHPKRCFYHYLLVIKQIRHSYLALLDLGELTNKQLVCCRCLIHHFFDQLELILSFEWETRQKHHQLQQINQYTAEFQEQARSLQQSETQLKTIIDTDVNGLLILDNQGVVLFANPSATALFGRPMSSILGTVLGLPIIEDQATEIEIQQTQNNLVIASLRSTVIPWQGRSAYLVSLTDVTQEKRNEEKFRMLWRAIEQSPTMIVITDAQGKIEYVNPKFEEITGYSAQEVSGQNPRLLKSDIHSPQIYQHLWTTITSGHEWKGELCNKKKNGDLYWESLSISPILNYEGQITHFVAIKEDITQRKQQEERLNYQANYDALTRLPNRFLVFDRLEQAIKSASRNQKKVAVMFLDLDHFKNINDTLGHDIGDQLLVQTAQRISSCIRKSDTVARLGGDEFIIILTHLDDYHSSETVANKILAVMDSPFQLATEEIFISTSIGITHYPNDGLQKDILLRNADTAMYKAKQEGRNRFKFFTASMNDKAQKRRKIETNLRHALRRREIYPVYQPLIDLQTQKIVGAEALMRWHSDRLGQISPDQFIPIAEDSGLISELGAWILQQACKDSLKWREYQPLIWLAVNLSPRQLCESNFIHILQSAINQYNLPSGCLELELTERLLVEDIPGSNDIIQQLHQMKIRLSLDDFGTGYSSLSYLKNFPFSVLKIDKSFISDIPHNLEVVSLVKTIMMMGHSLNLKVIAEGIETKEQATFLRYHGCDYGQGYYFSSPVLADQFLALIT